MPSYGIIQIRSTSNVWLILCVIIEGTHHHEQAETDFLTLNINSTKKIKKRQMLLCGWQDAEENVKGSFVIVN